MTAGIFGKSNNHSQPIKVQIVRKTTPYIGLLQLGFIFCKLAKITDIANWSWFWVMSPLWGLVVLVIACVLFFLFIVGLLTLFVGVGNFFSKRKNLKSMMRE